MLTPSLRATHAAPTEQSRITEHNLLSAAIDAHLCYAAQGENAWVFVGEDVIADSVKAYHKFNEKLLEKYPKEKRKDMKPTAISG